MLVLTRKTEEKIQIGSDITITILRIKGKMVKIGVEAPEGMLVLRTELIDASLAETSDDVRDETGEATVEDDDPAPERNIPRPFDPVPATNHPERRALRRSVAPEDLFTKSVGPALSPI